MFRNWPYEGQISVVIPGNCCLPLKDTNLSASLVCMDHGGRPWMIILNFLINRTVFIHFLETVHVLNYYPIFRNWPLKGELCLLMPGIHVVPIKTDLSPFIKQTMF